MTVEKTKTRPLRALIVEDDMPSLELISELVASRGVEARAICDSEVAATLIHQEQFDGIFLDLIMPKLDGFELIRQIRRSSLNMRTLIVIISGREDKDTMGEAFKAGATFFLHKPLNKNKLTQLLNVVVPSMAGKEPHSDAAGLTEPQRDATAAPAASAAPLTLKVLVVEDEPPLLEFISEVLMHAGVDVMPVSDSREAVLLVGSAKFDGILLDLMMPHVDGFELAREVRRSSWNRRTPIMVVSGLDPEKAIPGAFAAGGTFFVRKPVDSAGLLRSFELARQTMVEEHLRFKRVAIRTGVECTHEVLRLQGTSRDLSQEGMLLQTNDPLPVGSTVWLTFRLPVQPTRVRAAGVVVRRDKEGRAGIQFAWISLGDRERLRWFVRDWHGAAGTT